MGIIENIKEKYALYKARRTEKMLIRSDDETVVEHLTGEGNNSNIDIKSVIENMDDPNMMAEVVRDNLDEIINQDNVRDTFKYLNDSDIAKIMEENAVELEENNKLKNAIEAIDSNEKKLRETRKNIRNLTDIELSRILSTLKLEKFKEKNEKIEQEKIRLVSMKILEHIVKQGNVWHLNELTGTLKKESKIIVLDVCLQSIDNYCKSNSKNVYEQTKEKFVMDMFRTIDINYKNKYNKLNSYKKNGIFTEEQEKNIKEKMEKERIEKENANMNFGKSR